MHSTIKPQTMQTDAMVDVSTIREAYTKKKHKRLSNQEMQRKALDFAVDHFSLPKEISKTRAQKMRASYKRRLKSVQSILQEYHFDEDTLVAGILHAVYACNPRLSRSKVQKHFGNDIEQIVYNFYKLTTFRRLYVSKKSDVHNLRAMLISGAEDLRALMILLFDVLDSLRRWVCAHEGEHAMHEKARESLSVYSSIAEQLGFWNVKEELEDKSFAYLYPDQYKQLAEFFEKERDKRKEALKTFQSATSRLFTDNGINAQVSARYKHMYSVYKKMLLKHKTFDEIHDLLALRVIVPSVEDCYKVMTLIHNTYKPNVHRIKDFISVPKSNGYASLHTTVNGPDGYTVEVQIRTPKMDEMAQKGAASHVYYAENKQSIRADQYNSQYVRNLENLYQKLLYGNNSKTSEIFTDTIFVVVNDKRVLALQADTTLSEFLQNQYPFTHKKIASYRINGRRVSRDYVLKNLDRVRLRFRKRFWEFT